MARPNTALAAPCLALALGLAATVAQAQDVTEPLLVVYGADAGTREGDPDHIERLFFSMPADTSGPLYLRVFDADTGGRHDSALGRLNGSTDYRLYGGAGAFTTAARPAQLPNATVQPTFDVADLPPGTGTLLAEQSIAADAAFDDQWATLHSFDATMGEVVGDRLWFRLDVQGMAGDDGNAFAATISRDEASNQSPDALESVSFAPTMRWPGSGPATEVRLAVPADGQIILQNFDAAKGQLKIVTLYEDFSVETSGQNGWTVQTLQIPDPEAAITLVEGFEKPNDVTLSAFDAVGQALPLRMPPVRNVPFLRPTVLATAQPLSNCTSVAFDASGSIGTRELGYAWDFGDGATSTLPVIAHTYAAPGRYQATVSILDLRGKPPAGNRLHLPVHVRPAPIAMPGDPITVAPGDPVAFSGAASQPSDSPITRHEWTFGDGASAIGVDAMHVYAASGLYRAVLRVADDSKHPCSFGLATREVAVNHAPTAEAGTDRIDVVGGEVRLDGRASYDRDGTVGAWRWDMGDGTTLDGIAVTHAYAAPGTYAVTLTVTDGSGVSNDTATDSLTVIINAPPEPKGTGPTRPIAVGEVTTLGSAGSVDPDGEILNYLWSFGDGSVAEGPEVQYAWTTPGIYAATLTVTDNSGTLSSQTRTGFQVVVSAAPVADAGPDQAVTASVVSFDGGASADPDGRVTQWDWTFGDGGTASGQTVSHAYRAPGTYEVRLRVIDDSGAPLNTDEDLMTVVINATPVADAGPDQITAPGQPVTLDAFGSVDPDGNVAGYTWTYPDGTTADGALAERSFDQPGLYRIGLQVDDDFPGGATPDFDEVLVTVNASPVAVIGPDLLVEPGQPVAFSGRKSYDPDGAIGEYRWDFDDLPDPIRADATTRTFDTPGAVAVQLTVVDASGALNATDQTAITVRINHPPVADAGSEIATQSLLVDFNAAGSTDGDGDLLSYTWDFGDGTPPRQGSALRHAFPTSGRYPVTLTVDDGTGLGNARDSDATVVTIDAAPLAVAGGNRDICSGFPLLFDASGSTDPDGGLLRYQWDFGDGTTSDIVNPNKTYELPGSYAVTLTVQDETGTPQGRARDRIAALVREGPISHAGDDLQACTNQEVRFDGSRSTDADGAVNGFAWTFGDGGTGSGDRPTHVFTEPGVYTVNLTITGDSNGLCSPLDSDQMLAEVFPAPSLTIRADDRMAVGVSNPFAIEVSPGPDAQSAMITWDFGDGTQATGPEATHSFADAGVYLVTAYATFPNAVAACRDITAARKITVNAPPMAAIDGPITVATGESVLFDAARSSDPDGALTGFVWDFGDGTTAQGVSPRHSFSTPGSYAVTLTVSDDAGTLNSDQTATLQVTVNPTPYTGLTSTTAICSGIETVWRADAAPGTSASWTFGDGTDLTGAEVRHAFAEPGLYPVTLRMDDGRALPNSVSREETYARVNHPPVALAGPDRAVCPGEPVVFDASGSGDLDGQITGWRWDFDDGVTLNGATVTRQFDATGPVGVRLTVTDNSGAAACHAGEDTARIKVNGTPTVDAGPDREVLIGAAHDDLRFTAAGTTDPDGDGLTLTWDFGEKAQAQGGTVSHAYTKPGDYAVTITARDSTGLACGIATDSAAIKALARE